MNDEFDYFLLIAEELNISRAAKRAFVSQQSLSKYLKKLEEQYNTILFTRKPVFALTPAGKIMLQKVQLMKAIQSDMNRAFAELSSNPAGELTIGAPMGRAEIIFPQIIPEFCEHYPNISVTLKCEMTERLVRMIKNNTLDYAIGINPELTSDLDALLLYEEPFCLAISDLLLQKCFPDDYPGCKLRFNSGVDIKDFEHVPFVSNSPDSRFYKLSHKLQEAHSINLREIFHVNNGLIQAEMIRQGVGAAFIPFMLKNYLTSSRTAASGFYQALNFFPIRESTETTPIYLIHSKNSTIQPYMKYFEDLIVEKITSFTQNNPLSAE